MKERALGHDNSIWPNDSTDCAGWPPSPRGPNRVSTARLGRTLACGPSTSGARPVDLPRRIPRSFSASRAILALRTTRQQLSTTCAISPDAARSNTEPAAHLHDLVVPPP
jgi:hypothetical protein